MKKLLLLGLLLIFFNSVFAQKNYEKGYVVTIDNDTLFGLVKDRKPFPFSKIYKKIHFKNSSLKRRFGPSEIKSYKQGERSYESIWLKISSDLINESYSSIPYLGEKEFLKIIERGYLTYYQREIYDPESDTIDYIDLFKKEGENNLIRATQGIFGLRKESLINYFNDSKEIVSKIQSGDLKKPIDIVLLYNSLK